MRKHEVVQNNIKGTLVTILQMGIKVSISQRAWRECEVRNTWTLCAISRRGHQSNSTVGSPVATDCRMSSAFSELRGLKVTLNGRAALSKIK